MAIRAASIWRAVSQPGSVAWMPKSPNVTDVPPLAAPRKRPRWVLRCLTFLGISMSVGLLAEVRRLVVLVATLALHLLVLVQLALEVVGLGRLWQEVDQRLVGGGFLVRFRGRFVAGAVDGDRLFDFGLDLGLGLRIGFGIGRERLGPAPATACGDETARGALGRRLPDGHGGLPRDLVPHPNLV